MAIRLENCKYYGVEWKRIRQEVIQERGNKCEKCGGRPGRDVPHLTVHHRDRNPANNARENLLVCCPRGHFEEEAAINNGDRIPGQLELF